MAIEMKYQFDITEEDLRGMVETALGWHLSPEETDTIVEGCVKVHKQVSEEHGPGRMIVIFQMILKVFETKVKEAQDKEEEPG